MPFKIVTGEQRAPEDPEALFRDLRGRTIQGLLSQQADVLREYMAGGLQRSDVAIQLPTGSGKTLVGLLIAEWRRRKFNERVLYLCPTRQLVNQVVENATMKYGITLHALTGPKREFDRTKAAEYLAAESVIVTTYSALFNSAPFFEDPQTIVVDDAHAAEGYISSMWSLRIQRRTHEAMFRSVVSALREALSETDYRRVLSDDADHWDEHWIETVSSPKLDEVTANLEALLDAHCVEDEHRYSWNCLKGHLSACNLFLSTREVLIRPLVPPTFVHSPFAGAGHRIYMSATLGAGGDLERITGRKSIYRISPPAGFERQGVGRRLFLFPGRSLDTDDSHDAVRKMIGQSPRTLYLVPSDGRAVEAREWLGRIDGLSFFDARDLEQSKTTFVTSTRAVALVANRYDGIDLLGDECRLLVFDGFPSTTNLQEQFLMTRMAAGVLLDERIGTRLAQGFGRCTRSDTDYAVVVVLGDSISNHLIRAERRAHFHPELQAEIEFGLEQSRDLTPDEFLENSKVFLAQGEDWRTAESQLLMIRDSATRQARPGEADLARAVAAEVEYAESLWNGNLLGALGAAETVLGVLEAEELKGYRALWNYLAGSCAWRLAQGEGDGFRDRARDYFRRAASGASGLRWLHEVARTLGSATDPDAQVQAALQNQVCGIEEQLDRLGIVHNRKFEQECRVITEGLWGTQSPSFEQAHASLGRMLGFESGGEDGQAAPDAWWRLDSDCVVVFEDNADANPGSSLSVTKVRQAASHGAWLRDRLGLPESIHLVAVMVTPCGEIDRAAVPHGRDVRLWNLAELRTWTQRALDCVRALRPSYPGRPDLAWRADAMGRLRTEGVDANGLLRSIGERRVADLRVRG